MRKTIVGALVVTAALVGPAAMIGSAQAAGVGGNAVNNCLGVGLNLIGGIGIAGQGTQTGAACVAQANGID